VNPLHTQETILSLLQRPDLPQLVAGGKEWAKVAKRNPGLQGIYVWDHDTVLMIGFEAIPDDEWLMVLLHEWGHATGHTSRLNRPGAMMTVPDASGLIEAQEELTAWWFTFRALDHFGCLTNPTQRECAGQIHRWSRLLDTGRIQTARHDAEAAFQFAFSATPS
jgi:antirestriction protein ArdC